MVWRCTQTRDFSSTIWWHCSCLVLEREPMPFNHLIRHEAFLVLFQPCLQIQSVIQRRLIYKHLLFSPLLFLHWHHLHHSLCLYYLLDLAIMICHLPLYYNITTNLSLSTSTSKCNTQHWNQSPACQAGPQECQERDDALPFQVQLHWMVSRSHWTCLIKLSSMVFHSLSHTSVIPLQSTVPKPWLVSRRLRHT